MLPLLTLSAIRLAAAAGLDGWMELEGVEGFARPLMSWRILTEVEEEGVWPEGLLDAFFAMNPKENCSATPLGHGPLPVWCSWKSGFGLGFQTQFTALVVA